MKEEKEENHFDGKGNNHLGMIFDEAGQFPDMMKHYAMAGPKLDHLVGKQTPSKVSDFVWTMTGTGEAPDTNKYDRRKLK